MTITLASLFDGSGGFPLAAGRNGITAKWASEIEIYPKEVSSKNFPLMLHLGDVKGINGAEVEPVDIITFGSPCQGLSVAGKRKGLKDDRSCLFSEAIRIIKEMRRDTNGKYPSFAVWENVTGALNCSEGQDFREVLRQFASIVEGDSVPDLPDYKKWPNAGQILGRGWSFAWRVFDAQYFGVPQRRRRIYAVWHFGKVPAAEILFERQSLQRNPGTSRKEGEETSVSIGDSAETADRKNGIPSGTGTDKQPSVYDCRGLGNGNVTCTLSGDHSNRVTNTTPIVVNQIGGSGEKSEASEVTAPVRAEQANSPMCVCVGNGQLDQLRLNKVVGTQDCMHDQKCVLYASSKATYFQHWEKNLSPTEVATQWKDPHRILSPEPVNAIGLRNSEMSNGSALGVAENKAMFTLDTVSPHGVFAEYVVRRLTPTECARLQGFPDDWGKGVKHYSDSAEYKMWGNGIALPCALFVMKGIRKVFDFENRNH